MQPILKPCFKIKRGHWKTCRAKNAPYLGRTSPYPPFHWVPPPPRAVSSCNHMHRKLISHWWSWLRLICLPLLVQSAWTPILVLSMQWSGHLLMDLLIMWQGTARAAGNHGADMAVLHGILLALFQLHTDRKDNKKTTCKSNRIKVYI